MSSPSPLLVSDLSLRYPGQMDMALENISFSLTSGSLTGVIGPNGAGKSTLIKAALGLLKPQGEILFWGQSLKAVRQRVAYVPQRTQVDWDFPVSALDVVQMGLYGQIGWLGRLRKEHKEAALSAMERLRIADLAQRQIGNLSGGQQQRVFLARMLLQNADLCILDEPFAGIDAAAEEIIINLFQELKSEGKTILMVHHDLQTAATLFDDIILLNKTLLYHGSASEGLNDERLRQAYHIPAFETGRAAHG
ncbi:MAG: metal ABC transporter ATP-binding protein [Alphaproteobacteria bacterium]|nr:metal ABC transporter ATP-binding protein [Alphaproteobacteria bacterium]